MAKSKAFKAMRQQQREEDLNQTEALDDSFSALLQGGALAGMLNVKGRKDNRKQPVPLVEPGDAAYDRLRRELTFEPKGKVSVAWQATCLSPHLMAHETIATPSMYVIRCM